MKANEQDDRHLPCAAQCVSRVRPQFPHTNGYAPPLANEFSIIAVVLLKLSLPFFFLIEFFRERRCLDFL